LPPPVTDLISPPDLSQARVNKCLIALVNRKVVQKNSSTGTVLYHWQGI
jgi:DASH complex subunit DAM1